MEELEKLLIEEIEANIETTFLYQFHEKNFFDREKFQLLIVNVNKMANYYISNGRTEYYKKIAAGIIDRFEYILCCFYWHLAPNDLCSIINYNDIKDEISDYCDKMREVTGKLILQYNNRDNKQHYRLKSGTLSDIIGQTIKRKSL